MVRYYHVQAASKTVCTLGLVMYCPANRPDSVVYLVHFGCGVVGLASHWSHTGCGVVGLASHWSHTGCGVVGLASHWSHTGHSCFHKFLLPVHDLP